MTTTRPPTDPGIGLPNTRVRGRDRIVPIVGPIPGHPTAQVGDEVIVDLVGGTYTGQWRVRVERVLGPYIHLALLERLDVANAPAPATYQPTRPLAWVQALVAIPRMIDEVHCYFCSLDVDRDPDRDPADPAHHDDTCIWGQAVVWAQSVTLVG